MKPLVLITALFALSTSMTVAAATSISQVLASPSSYDGSHVDVTGQVEHLERKVSHKGNPM